MGTCVPEDKWVGVFSPKDHQNIRGFLVEGHDDSSQKTNIVDFLKSDE